mmetsp:Transcript_112114/g.317541  ORF Transcript_112114/g.317541 Transcript_112114/m.317541 type:complete len:288 (-) Transcript_112114:614-1477(-)
MLTKSWAAMMRTTSTLIGCCLAVGLASESGHCAPNSTAARYTAVAPPSLPRALSASLRTCALLSLRCMAMLLMTSAASTSARFVRISPPALRTVSVSSVRSPHRSRTQGASDSPKSARAPAALSLMISWTCGVATSPSRLRVSTVASRTSLSLSLSSLTASRTQGAAAMPRFPSACTADFRTIQWSSLRNLAMSSRKHSVSKRLDGGGGPVRATAAAPAPISGSATARVSGREAAALSFPNTCTADFRTVQSASLRSFAMSLMKYDVPTSMDIEPKHCNAATRVLGS